MTYFCDFFLFKAELLKATSQLAQEHNDSDALKLFDRKTYFNEISSNV